MQYNPTLMTAEGVEYPNPNLIKFATVPTISSKYMLAAYQWSIVKVENKERIIIRIDDIPVKLFVSSSKSTVTLSKRLCRDFLEHESNPQFDNFGGLIKFFKSIHCVTVNRTSWELSTCTCSFYQKNNKCYHMISLCAFYKAPGCSFASVIMDQPLGRKAGRGRKPKRKTALVRDDAFTSFETEATTSAEAVAQETTEATTPAEAVVQETTEAGNVAENFEDDTEAENQPAKNKASTGVGSGSEIRRVLRSKNNTN